MLFNICVMSSEVVINESVRSVCFCTDFRMQRDEYKVKSRPQKLVWELLMRPGMCCRLKNNSLECQWEPKKIHTDRWPNAVALKNQIAAAPWVLRVAASKFQGRRALWVWKWPRSQIFFSLELKKSFHWAHVPQFKGARESNCCSSVSFASCGV